MADSSESSDSVDSSSELSEFEDVEVLNNATVEIVPCVCEVEQHLSFLSCASCYCSESLEVRGVG